MNLIAYLILIAAGLLDLLAMLRLDAAMMQTCDFDNRQYNKQLKDNDEFISSKRLLAIAVLIGALTTMSQMSWIVVLILAAVILAQSLILWTSSCRKQPASTKRTQRLQATAIALAMILIGAVTAGLYLSGFNSIEICRSAAMLELAILTFSPMLTIAANQLLPTRK